MRAAVALHEFAILANIFESFVSLLRSGGKVGTAIRPALRHPLFSTCIGDSPKVFNRVPQYKNETNEIHDEYYRQKFQWDTYRYNHINNEEIPHPGHKVII